MPLNSLLQEWQPRPWRTCSPYPWWLRECAFLVTRRFSRPLASKSSVWIRQLRTYTLSGVPTSSPKKTSKHSTKLALPCQEPARIACLPSLLKSTQRPRVILTRARHPSSTTLCWRVLTPLVKSLVVVIQPWRLCKVLLFYQMEATFLLWLTVKSRQ